MNKLASPVLLAAGAVVALVLGYGVVALVLAILAVVFALA